MYPGVIRMINSRPLTLSLHPNIKEVCKQMGEEPGVITPFQLYFGLKPQKNHLIPLENQLEPQHRGAYTDKWQKILIKHDQMLEEELQHRIEAFKGLEIEVGDLVLVKNMVAHKEQLKYYKDLYQILRIKKSRYYCTPLFGKGILLEVNGNNLKPHAYSELYSLLPPEIKVLLGENMSLEELKNHSRKEPNSRPIHFMSQQFWKRPPPMQLRRRLTPQSVRSNQQYQFKIRIPYLLYHHQRRQRHQSSKFPIILLTICQTFLLFYRIQHYHEFPNSSRHLKD
jgi:hypothetical protein